MSAKDEGLGIHGKLQDTTANGMCQEYIIRETMVRSRNSKKSSKILPMAQKYCMFQEKIIHTANLVQVIGSYDR